MHKLWFYSISLSNGFVNEFNFLIQEVFTLITLIRHNFSAKQFFGNKAKGRISKGVFQENKARKMFLKTNISYPLRRTICFLETPV